MNSKLAWGLGLCFFLLAGRASLALAPTGIEVDSSLNQPLKARVGIFNASEEALASLKVRQAQTGDPLDLRFRIERDDSGGAVVQVTTRRPVREPALNFVLEFEWDGGRLLREYSILLDPQ